VRRVYTITRQGTAALQDAKQKVSELFGELFEKD
jgi:DNA-binding PadR family transcriptional regulator